MTIETSVIIGPICSKLIIYALSIPTILFISEEIVTEQLKRTQFLPAIIYENDPSLASL